MTDHPTAFVDVPTPIGLVRIFARAGAIVRIEMETQEDFDAELDDGARSTTTVREPVLERAATQLGEYFAGTRREFDLPLTPEQGTTFQRRAWRALESIPYGQTRSYGAQARVMGSPAAVRAVGAANGRNPIAIVVPCHRVIGADGSLTGYGGGIANKRWLLAHEARVAASDLTAPLSSGDPAAAT